MGPFALIVAGVLVMIFAFQDPKAQGESSGAWLGLNLAFSVPLMLVGIFWWVWKHRRDSRVSLE